MIENPIIFFGAPHSGVEDIASLFFYHSNLTWLDRRFTQHPFSKWEHSLFQKRIALTHLLPKTTSNPFIKKINTLLRPSPTEAMTFWDEITRDDIHFPSDFLYGKTSTKIEKQLIQEVLMQRMKVTEKKHLGLFFIGPARFSFFNSLFSKPIFIQVQKDPVLTIYTMLKCPIWNQKIRHFTRWYHDDIAINSDDYEKFKENPINHAAFQLNQLQQLANAEKKQLGLSCLRLRYEDFFNHPKKTLNQITEHTKIDASECLAKVMEFTKENRPPPSSLLSEKMVSDIYTICPHP